MLRALVSTMIFLGVPATAQTFVPGTAGEPCVTDGGPDSCVKVLACIGDRGRWFEGRAIGSGSGILQGRTSDGVTCSGTWTIEPSGLGRTEAACENGTTAELIAEYQDHRTGTAIGEGVTSEGEKILSFSGRNVVEFLTDDGVSVLPCGDGGVELDQDGMPIS